jgi:ubiquinone/menaquinone biosynthesis C-methylase UbiE
MHKADESPVHISAGKPAGSEDLIILRRYRLIRAHAPLEGRVLLDFGCGNGVQTMLFADDFPVVIGLDIGSSHLKQLGLGAGERGLSGRILPVQYDGKHIPMPDGSVDCAVSFEVLEHVLDERQALAELSRVIRPGGLLYVTAPMDVVKIRFLKRLLRGTVFRNDSTRVPFLSTALLVIARRVKRYDMSD